MSDTTTHVAAPEGVAPATRIAERARHDRALRAAPLREPRAVAPRLRRAAPRPRRGRLAAAARAREVHGDLLRAARRVLPGARRGPRGPGRGRASRPAPPTGSGRASSSSRSASARRSSSAVRTASSSSTCHVELAAAGIRIESYDALGDEDREALREFFVAAIYPILTPLAVDPGHPFPMISNLSLNLAVQVTDPATGEERLARVKVPPVLPRFLPIGDGERFVASRPGHRRAPRHPVPRDAPRRARDLPRHPQRRPQLWRRRRPRTSSSPSRWSCAGAASVARCASRSSTRSPRGCASCSCASST